MSESELLNQISEQFATALDYLGVLTVLIGWIAATLTWRVIILVKNQKYWFALLAGVGMTLSGISPASAQDITTGKTHQWDLFEDAGSDGGSSGAALSIVGTVSVTGERATGFSSSNYLTMPSMAAYASDSSYSISLWCSAASFPGAGVSRAAVSIGGPSGSASDSLIFYPFHPTPSNGARAYFGPLGGFALGAAGYPTVSVDNHLVLVCESTSSAKLYVNGTVRATYSGNMSLPGTTSGGAIGTWHAGVSQSYVGSLGQVKVFSRALNSTDVIALKAQDEAEIAAFRAPPDGPGPGGCSELGCETTWTVVDMFPNDGTINIFAATGGVAAPVIVGMTKLGNQAGIGYRCYRNAGSGGRVEWESPTGERVTWHPNGFDAGALWSKVSYLYCSDDRDGDGQCDNVDCDDDNDEMLDVDEDNDGDGIPNDEDDDDDDDGCPDNGDCEDDDEDGLANCEDPDDDNDGSADHVDCDWYGEGGGCEDDPPVDDDLDDDGVPNNTDWDDDGDGIPDWIDLDDDGDGTPDAEDEDHSEEDEQDPPTDTDGDGIPDFIDPDDDNDGTPDHEDEDDDGDGTDDDEDPDHDPCGNCNTDDNDGTGQDGCSGENGEDCNSGPDQCPGLGEGFYCCSEGSESNTDDRPCNGLPPCTDTCGEEEPEEPGGEGCACCEELLGLLEYNVPDGWKPTDQSVYETEDGIGGGSYTTAQEPGATADEVERFTEEREDIRRTLEQLKTGEAENEDDVKESWMAFLPDAPSVPVPETGSDMGDMLIEFPFIVPGYWSPGGDNVYWWFEFHTLPLANMTSWPQYAPLWTVLETLRLMIRPLILGVFLWWYKSKFIKVVGNI